MLKSVETFLSIGANNERKVVGFFRCHKMSLYMRYTEIKVKLLCHG